MSTEDTISGEHRVALRSGRRREYTPSPLPEIAVDSNGTIVGANDEALELFRYEMLGNDVELLVPEKFRESHVKLRADFTRQPVSRPMKNSLVFPGRRGDGSEVFVQVWLVPDWRYDVIRAYILDATPYLASIQMNSRMQTFQQVKVATAAFVAAGGFNVLMDVLKSFLGG